MQNFLPCKTSPQNRCDVSNGNGVIYEDLTNIRPRALPNHCASGQTAPSIEMIDVKGPSTYGGNGNIFVCQAPPRGDSYGSQDLYNPVYEELSNGSGERADSEAESEAMQAGSEDEFADEELSLGGDAEARPAPPGSPPTPLGPPAPPVPPLGPPAPPAPRLKDRDADAPHVELREAERERERTRQRYAHTLQPMDSLMGPDDRTRYTIASPRTFGGPAGAGYRQGSGGSGGGSGGGSSTGRSSRRGGNGAAPAPAAGARAGGVAVIPTSGDRRPRSLDRRRGWRAKNQQAGGGGGAPSHGGVGGVGGGGGGHSPRASDLAVGTEFHEGLLLDALLQFYPSRSGRGGERGVPAACPGSADVLLHSTPYAVSDRVTDRVPDRLPYFIQPGASARDLAAPPPPRNLVDPYESVPVLNHLHQQQQQQQQHHHHHHHPGYGPPRPDMFSTFRPAPAPSQDSSFGSDSGYSNNTSGGGTVPGGGGGGDRGGGGGGRTGSRSRKDGHRLSAHSGDLVLS